MMNSKLIEQSASIAEMQSQLNTKVTKAELKSSMKVKANSTDVLQSLNDLQSVIDTLPSNDLIQILLDKKASLESVDTLAHSISKLSDNLDQKANREFVIHSLHTKENKSALNEQKLLVNSLYKTVQEVKRDNSQLNEAINFIQNELREKIDSIDHDLDVLVENIKKQFASFNNALNDINQSKVDGKDIDSYLRKHRRDKEDIIRNELDDKMKRQKLSVDEMLNQLSNDITKRIYDNDLKTTSVLNEQNAKVSSIKDELRSDLNIIDEKVIKMHNETNAKDTLKQNETIQIKQDDDKIDINELENKVNSNYTKLINEINALSTELQRKVTYGEINDLLSNKIDSEYFNMAIANKVSRPEIEQYLNDRVKGNIVNHIDQDTHLMKTNNSLSELSYELKDLKDSIIMKVNIKEVYELLKDKPNIKDVNIALSDMHSELESKVSFNEYNRAMKKQAELNAIICKENCLGKWLWTSKELKNCNIKWNIQLSNSAPEVFYLEKETGFILIKATGIYSLQIGLINSNSALLQINVNGSPIIANSDYKKERNVMQMDELISIEEENSRIAISFSGLSLQREVCFLLIKSII